MNWTRVVASGIIERIGFFYAVNPDCSASGDINIRITKQPEHGTAETAAATSFPNFERENIRYRCNQHEVRGQQLIPVPIDQNPCAHWRSPMDMMRQG